VSIGIIAAQKLPPKPAKAADGMLVGASHDGGGIPIEAEGGEFIINKRSTSKYLPLLDAINQEGVRKKFAEGGVTAPVAAATEAELIDYEKLAAAIMNNIQPTVAVVEINKAQQRVKVIEQSATL